MKIFILLAGLCSATGLVAFAPAVRGQASSIHAHLSELVHGQSHGASDHGADAVADHLDQMAVQLGLTTAQRKQLAGVFSLNCAGLEQHFTNLLSAHRTQAASIHAPRFDESAIRSASVGVSSAQEELAVALAKLLHDVHAVLTPEQLQHVAQLHMPDLLGRAARHVHAVAGAVQSWSERQ